MTRLIGYARVSTQDQSLELQSDALKQIGCVQIFIDKISGAKTERPGLDECLNHLKQGDILVVWRIDRLGRTIKHLITLIDQLRQKGIGFKSICEGAIDTTTASGALTFNIFSSLAEFERQLIRERTNAGLAVARARGKKGGRKQIEKVDPRVIIAQKMHKNNDISIADICKTLKISKSTLYRFLKLK